MPLPRQKIISLDTEEPGVDLWHGADPYMVQVGFSQEDSIFWEWDVDPINRQVQVIDDDLDAIQAEIDSATIIVGHHIKFDFNALDLLFRRRGRALRWDWAKVRDTLMGSHLLGSANKHDLTSEVLNRLGIRIEPWEAALEKATKEARRLVQRKDFIAKHGKWRIAKEGDPLLPSVKGSSTRDEDKPWRNDTWLPRTVARLMEYEPDHLWWTVASEYGCMDVASTWALLPAQEAELRREDLWEIFLDRMRLPEIAASMQQEGVTASRKRQQEVVMAFEEESERLNNVCMNIAESYGYNLDLPKNGVNNSLRGFCFDVLKLKEVYNPKAKTSAPCLDSKNAIPYYLDTLPPNSKELLFIKSLSAKRKRDTSVGYAKSYERFWLPVGASDEWFCLHSSLNPTGTTTLRWSSYNPNSENISKQESVCAECEGDGCEACNGTGVEFRSMRYIFGPAPGREWWVCDAKNIELRLPAYECGERELIDLFEKPDDPPYYGSEHLLNFSTVYSDIWDQELRAVGIEKVGPHCKKKYAATWYQRVKNGGFAMGYGSVDKPGGAGTADRTFGRPGSQARLKTRFAKKEALNQRWIAFAEKHGYVETMPDYSVNPRRGYPLMCSRTDRGRIKPTVPLNYHIQGCLDGTSRVWTTIGLIPIKDLVGKVVNVWTGFKWAPAVGLDRGPCRKARVRLSSGLVVNCDTRHKLKNEWDEWVGFSDLKVGDCVSLPKHNNRLEFSGSINWWFVFGFIVGDGCLQRRGGRKLLSICGGATKKDDLWEMYQFLLKEGYTGNKYKYKDRGGVRWRVLAPRQSHHHELYHVDIENRNFADFLERQGFSFDWKFDTKRVPEPVWLADPLDRRDFLEGLWRSDGHRNIQAGSGRFLNMRNRLLLEDVQKLASSVGFDSHFASGQLCFRWRNFWAKSSRPYPASRISRLVKDVVRSRYETKNEATVDLKNLKLAREGKDISQYTAERMIEINAPSEAVYRYDKIEAIEVLDVTENTFTMSVDDPLHQFVADGVIHKNTAMWWMCRAMIRCHEVLRGTGARIAAQIHDELVFDFPKGDGAEPWRTNYPAVKKLTELMSQGGDDIGVPTPVSMEYHPDNYSESMKVG